MNVAIPRPHAREAYLAERPSFAEAAAPANRLAVYRYLLHLTGDPHAAEDLTQEAFARALSRLDRYDPSRGPLRPWLVAVARRVAIDEARSSRSRRARERRFAAAQPPAEPEPEVPGDVSGDLRAALATLTPAERETVALRVVVELSAADAAQVMGVTPSACSTTLHRALGKLRRALDPEAPRV
ncbi:MAG: sigma-70 family RNA polymerase sigma factor [Actinomycetota bacterium]